MVTCGKDLLVKDTGTKSMVRCVYQIAFAKLVALCIATLHPRAPSKCMMMMQKRSLTFLVVVFVSDPIAIEVNAGDEIPRATNAFTAVFPPSLADRSKVRLDVASMMVMIVVVELYGRGSMASSVENYGCFVGNLWLGCHEGLGC